MTTQAATTSLGDRRGPSGEGSCCGSLKTDEDRIVMRVCSNYLRQLWRQKVLVFVITCIVYVTSYIAIVTVQSRSTLPKGRLLFALNTAGSEINKSQERSKQVKRYMTFGLPSTHTVNSSSFSREDLRLQFKELSFVNHTDPSYDNKDQYRCTLSQGEAWQRGQYQDTWCMDRPKYIPEFKNPCYVREGSGIPSLPTVISCLPYFHILGVDKCGTTDFHARLVRHPQILPNAGGLGKEVYYWCWLRYGIFMLEKLKDFWSFSWYTQGFEAASHTIVTNYYTTRKQLITGDGTPMDLWDFRGWPVDPQNLGLDEPKVITPHAMRHMYKNPRFFVLMRDPVERMYSDYIFLGYGFSGADFARDVPVAIAIMQDCLKVNSVRQCFYSDDMYHRLPMRLHVSCYSVFLREWLSVFDRRHFFFMRTEDYHNDTSGSLKAAFEFLGVDPLEDDFMHTLSNQSIKHKTVFKAKAGAIFPETRKLLEEFYSRFNEDLAKLLGDERFLWKDSKSRSTS